MFSKISSRYLEKWPSFGILKVENGHFSRCSLWLLYFPIFNLVWFGPCKSVLRSFFALGTKNWPKTFITPPKHKLFNWPYLDSWRWMTLTLNMLTGSLGWYLEVSQTRSELLYWLISIWCSFCAWQPDAPNRQTFWLWPDLWRHQWPRGQQL